MLPLPYNTVSSRRRFPGSNSTVVIDTLKEIGSHSNSNVVFVPHSPDAVQNRSDQIRETVFAEKLGRADANEKARRLEKRK
jgi:hypothetical protein